MLTCATRNDDASGLDVGDPESHYAAKIAHETPGGGGTVEDITITGGQYVQIQATENLLEDTDGLLRAPP